MWSDFLAKMIKYLGVYSVYHNRNLLMPRYSRTIYLQICTLINWNIYHAIIFHDQQCDSTCTFHILHLEHCFKGIQKIASLPNTCWLLCCDCFVADHFALLWSKSMLSFVKISSIYQILEISDWHKLFCVLPSFPNWWRVI